MNHLVPDGQEKNPLVFVTSIIFTLIQFPCGSMVLLKNENSLHIAKPIAGFFFPLGSFIILTFLFGRKDIHDSIYLQEWHFFLIGLVLGILGLITCFYSNTVGKYTIAAASGWALADMITFFINERWIQASLYISFSFIGIVILYFIPNIFTIMVSWMGADLLISSIKLFTVSIVMYNFKTDQDIRMEYMVLQIGCIISIWILFLASLVKPNTTITPTTIIPNLNPKPVASSHQNHELTNLYLESV